MPTTNDPASGNWHLDKRVPLSLITAIAIQTVVVASVLTTKSIQIEDHEKRLSRQENESRAVDASINDWIRRAAGRQAALDEHSSKIAKLERSDSEHTNSLSVILQQLSRIDERTAQLSAALAELRNEIRQARNNSRSGPP